MLSVSFSLLHFVNIRKEHCWVCTIARETSFYYGQPHFLFTFGIMHLEHLKVRSWKFRLRNSNLQRSITFSVCHLFTSALIHFLHLTCLTSCLAGNLLFTLIINGIFFFFFQSGAQKQWANNSRLKLKKAAKWWFPVGSAVLRRT